MKYRFVPKPIYLVLAFIAFFHHTSIAQVGIGTVTPNGILDVYNETQGVVLPKLVLTDTYIAVPAINPNTGGNDIPTGTVVYNTNATNHGAIAGISDDVTPGIYVWDGTLWLPQFTRKHYTLYEQSVQDIRTQSYEGERTINGINGQSFTANYTGSYKIEVNANFGGGQVKIPARTQGQYREGRLNVSRMYGDFKLSFNGSDYIIPAHSTSLAYSDSNGNGNQSTTNFFGIWKQWTVITYVQLVAGTSYTIDFTFDQDNAKGFLSEGNNDDNDTTSFDGGDGHVGFDIPCTVEFTFIGEQ